MKNQSAYRPAEGSFFNTISNVVMDALDRFTNSIFALNHDAALIRQSLVMVSFAVIWLVLSYIYLSPTEYTNLVNAWRAAVKVGSSGIMLISGIKIIVTVFFNMVVIRHMLALYIPYWLMQQVAAIYLADIFEKDEKVAHTFIQHSAFGGYYHTIRIRQGKIAKEDEESPIIQIGGPGYVVSELESAVVFERPDGTTRVIGPTHKEHRGKVLLQGFERIRQGVDLRDVVEKLDITTRSRDGIPVTAKDVQYRYSIYRGVKPVKSPQAPYPYDENAVLNLVYGTTRPVKIDETPVQKHDWLEPLPGKIIGQVIGEMSGFINKRGLSDFLVVLGKPEDESFEERRKDTTERIRAISGQVESDLPGSDAEIANLGGSLDGSNPAETARTAMEFVPREVLTKLFYDSFQSKAPQRGTQLNWIGVGTWDTPSQISLKNHQEAWKLSRENFARSNPTELKRLYDIAWRQEYIRLIEEVPIHKLKADPQNLDDDQLIKGLLKEYLVTLERARELYRRENIPEEILKAISEIERWLYSEHYAVG